MKSSGRKALQPRNIFLVPGATTDVLKPKAHELVHKEKLQAVDGSLAEELSAFKKKLETLREDRDRTEKLLKERDGAIDLQMTHLLQRGEIQKTLEIQVDRLFRLKELHAYSSKISPIQSLRAKEQEKRKWEPLADEPEEESSLAREITFPETLGSNHLDSVSVL